MKPFVAFLFVTAVTAVFANDGCNVSHNCRLCLQNDKCYYHYSFKESACQSKKIRSELPFRVRKVELCPEADTEIVTTIQASINKDHFEASTSTEKPALKLDEKDDPTRAPQRIIHHDESSSTLDGKHHPTPDSTFRREFASYTPTPNRKVDAVILLEIVSNSHHPVRKLTANKPKAGEQLANATLFTHLDKVTREQLAPTIPSNDQSSKVNNTADSVVFQMNATTQHYDLETTDLPTTTITHTDKMILLGGAENRTYHNFDVLLSSSSSSSSSTTEHTLDTSTSAKADAPANTQIGDRVHVIEGTAILPTAEKETATLPVVEGGSTTTPTYEESSTVQSSTTDHETSVTIGEYEVKTTSDAPLQKDLSSEMDVIDLTMRELENPFVSQVRKKSGIGFRKEMAYYQCMQYITIRTQIRRRRDTMQQKQRNFVRCMHRFE